LKRYKITYDEETHFCEDSLFGSMLLYHATNFFYLKGHHYYNYFYNPTSTTNTYNVMKWNSYLKINERLIKYFGGSVEFDFSRQIKINMLYFTLNALGQLKNSNNEENRLVVMKNIMHNPKVADIFIDFKLPDVSWKTKVVILLIKFKLVRLYRLLLLNNR
jgi:hypothetical protein